MRSDKGIHRTIAMFLAALVLWADVAVATTWSESKLPDPFAPGEECTVAEPASSGSYIYQWPEKFDQVFWPMTDTNAISVCPASGFVAWMNDFDLEPAEKSRVESFLKSQPPAKLDTPPERMTRLLAVYEQRDIKPAFRLAMLRAAAYVYERSDPADFTAARGLRERALVEIDRALGSELSTVKRLEYLFVTAAYQREFGNPKASDEALAALEAELAKFPPADDSEESREQEADEAEAADESDENLSVYADYLRDLIPEVRRIEPGGVLAPVATED